MRLSIPLLLWFAMAAAAEPVPPPAAASAREVALDNLLSERDSVTKFDELIKSAKEAGISEQSILEARFLFHVDRREDDRVAAMLPEFLNQREKFKIGDSAIFSVKEDWLAVVEYVQAIAALGKGDRNAFKSHITEAFWLSPRQASAFAPHIERVRLEEAMRGVKIDFGIRLISLANGEAASLDAVMPDRKATVLHFWSPANRESESSLPDYLATAKALGEKGIAMVSILPDDAPEILTAARKLVLPPGVKPPGAWLIDRKDEPLARELRVQTLPAFILISNEGAVLFNGDPADEGFWEALAKLDPQLVRPASPAGDE